MNSNKKFWTVDDEGQFVLRDLEWEAKNWFDRRNGTFDETKVSDPYNSCWFEIFDFYDCGSDGCDYEKYGCQIKPGDVVVDIGANIGIFAHRAEFKGASKVYSFEPVFDTFLALKMNSGPRTHVFKSAIFSDSRIVEMSIPDKKSNTGGGSIKQKLDELNRESIHSELVQTIPINDLFLSEMVGKIDFLKMDIEGAEMECLGALTDENLSSLRCLSVEFHRNIQGIDEFRNAFLERCNRLEFDHFTMYYKGGKQMTINIWKK